MSKFTKYTGVDFYEDYILPTTNASKNPLWRNLWKSSWKFMQDNTTETLQSRVNLAYIYGGIHAVFAILTAQGWIISTKNIMLQLLVNIYPIFVQLKTRNRIMRVLEHREWRKNKHIQPTEEGQLEGILEADIRMLEKTASIQ